MEKIVFAKSKYVGSSARKTRLIVNLIRGKQAMNALDMLKFLHKDVAHDVYKTVNSAVSNAVHNFNLDRKKLSIVQAYVNEAPTLKRGRSVARGRYHQILKRNSHIVIGVMENLPAKAPDKVQDKKVQSSTKVAAKSNEKTEKKGKAEIKLQENKRNITSKSKNK